MSGGGVVALIDIDDEKLKVEKTRLEQSFEKPKVELYNADITNREQLEKVREDLVAKYGHIDILINNAANNPKVESEADNMNATRFDDFPLEIWNNDVAVGLTGAFLCTQVFGKQMEIQKEGVILNISSDLGIIAPDQRIYRKEGLAEEKQTIKPVTYSVIKHGLIGLTKYTATYWAKEGIRVNCVLPGNVSFFVIIRYRKGGHV